MKKISRKGFLKLASAAAMSGILLANGWTGKTAACVIVFTLMHWPCSTTLLSIKKETGSRTWTVLAAVLRILYT